jgi:hypothetical protein
VDDVCGNRGAAGENPPIWARRNTPCVATAVQRAPALGTDVPALTIELGRDVRVRIAATAPAALVTAVIKALALR